MSGIGRIRGPLESVAAAAPVRAIHLEARAVSWQLAPGRIVKAMAYNGRVVPAALEESYGQQCAHHARAGYTRLDMRMTAPPSPCAGGVIAAGTSSVILPEARLSAPRRGARR
jgi:hypothetical protein